MTVEAARPRRRRAPVVKADPEPTLAPASTYVPATSYSPASSYAASASIAIGEIDQTVFDCPSCARPLALGARRCPGCKTRLLNGVTLGKASAFVAAGLAIGLLFGAGGGLVFGLSHPLAAAAVAAVPSGAPAGGASGAGSTTDPHATATPSRSAGPTPTATPANGIPPLTRSALVQVIATNARFAIADAALREALAARAFDASSVAQVLRTLSSDSVFGQHLADRVAAWPGSSEVGAELVTFYQTVHGTAADGLAASVQNGAAYRAAAIAIVKLLGEMPAIDAAVRSTATSAGIDLPSAGAPTAP